MWELFSIMPQLRVVTRSVTRILSCLRRPQARTTSRRCQLSNSLSRWLTSITKFSLTSKASELCPIFAIHLCPIFTSLLPSLHLCSHLYIFAPIFTSLSHLYIFARIFTSLLPSLHLCSHLCIFAAPIFIYLLPSLHLYSHLYIFAPIFTSLPFLYIVAPIVIH